MTHKTHFELRAALDAAGLLQSDLARLCGVTPRQVSNWCQGRAVAPSYVWALLSLLCGADKRSVRAGRWSSFCVERRHVFRGGDTYKSLARRFHPDLSGRDTKAEMQIVNQFK